jgi:MFS transporter, PAT family, beta-lactamase induction signal transducer AmpG
MAFRFLFGPLIDHHGTKRLWVLRMQRVIVFLMLLVAGLCGWFIALGDVTEKIHFLIIAFSCLSFCSVLHDVAWGGYFLTAVDERDKALFVGVNSAFIRLAIIFSQGFMVILAGKVGQVTGQVMAGWAVCFAVLGTIQLVLMIYHHFIYPFPALDKPIEQTERESFFKVFDHFFEQPRAWVILSFVFLYRLGEGLLARMKVPFLMDTVERGGLGLSLENIGIMNGVFTVLAMVAGGVIGGLMVKKFGLRRVIFPFALLLTLPNLGFIWLAAYPVYTMIHLFGMEVNPWALGALLIEAFGYGMGFASFGFLHCEASRGPYRATFFALMTSTMILSWTLTGSLSGLIQARVGYVTLFILSVVFALPGILIIRWLPLRELEARGKQEDAIRHAVG